MYLWFSLSCIFDFLYKNKVGKMVLPPPPTKKKKKQWRSQIGKKDQLRDEWGKTHLGEKENVISCQKRYELTGKENSNETWRWEIKQWGIRVTVPAIVGCMVWYEFLRPKSLFSIWFSLFTCFSLNLPGKFKSLSRFFEGKFC